MYDFQGEKKEKYYGALTYRAQDSYAGVGIWMKIDITSEALDKKESSLLKLKSFPSEVYFFNMFLCLILVYSTIFLLLILILLSRINCST